jgi:hypothetical protein
MSKAFKLMMFCRPFEKFDVENPQHRFYFKQFEEKHSWAHCPFQWIIEDDTLTVPDYIKGQLTEYYYRHDTALQELIKPNPVTEIKNAKVKYFGNQKA